LLRKDGVDLLRRERATAVLLIGLAGCLFAGMRGDAPVATTSLTSAQVHASTSAPCLPILVLRTARDELELPDVDRTNVAMVVGVAELDARTIDRARAALLEGLARSVEAGAIDDSLLAVLVEQMAWAAEEVAPRLARALDHLYLLLTPEQRAALVARVEAKLPNWSQTWAAGTMRHRWLEEWPDRQLPEFTADLTRTSQTWAEKSVANVRTRLPRLDPAERRALAASLRTGGED
jgi:hypothetical protein